MKNPRERKKKENSELTKLEHFFKWPYLQSNLWRRRILMNIVYKMSYETKRNFFFIYMNCSKLFLFIYHKTTNNEADRWCLLHDINLSSFYVCFLELWNS